MTDSTAAPPGTGDGPDRLGRRLRLAALVWGAAMVVLVGVSTLLDGLPPLADSTGIDRHLVRPSILGGLALYAIALSSARRALGPATLLLAVATWALAVIFLVSRSLGLGLLAGTGFGIPVTLLWLSWQRPQPGKRVLRVTTATMLIAAVVAGGSWKVLDERREATHPPSDVAGLTGPVEWLWAGGTTTDSARVVARLVEPAPAATQLLVGDDADLEGARRFEGEVLEAADSAVVRFDVNGLAPDQQYHYALDVDGVVQTGSAGRFRTMPDGPASFTLAVSACARTGSNGTVFDTIRERDPLLFLHTGDLHYGDISEDDPALFRSEYDASLAAPAQSALYRSTSTAYVWDDHDYGDNDSSRRSPSRQAAQEVFRQYVPHYPLGADERGEAGVYQAFTVGRARIILTDLRSHRSRHEVPDGPEKTLLGDDQLQWFEQELHDAADAGQLVLWVSTIPWIGATDPEDDDWAGYTHERRRIADTIGRLGLADQLVMLGGDAHMVAIDDGSNSDYSTEQTGGFPTLHAAALDRPGSIKGGPYSEGTFPGGGQFGEVEVRDDGETMEVVLRGLTYEGKVLVERTFDVTPAPPEPAS
jgi:phosphodiesterase/alkaline phosphatase D-like protein